MVLKGARSGKGETAKTSLVGVKGGDMSDGRDGGGEV